MDIEQKKRIVTEYFQNIGDVRHRQKSLDLMTDDATWWNPSGVRNKAQVAANFERADKFFKGPIKVTITGMTVEGDRVAVESEGHADVINGKHYHNAYHSLVVFRGDKICAVKEYCDTKYAAETLSGVF